METHQKPFVERFWSKVNKNGPMATHMTTACWIWKASFHRNGYGNFSVNGKTLKAHRVVWELVNGPIPDGMCVLHKCDVPSCVNVEHLFLGTQLENISDRDAKGRTASVHGEMNGSSKLTEDDVRSIFKLHWNGWTGKSIAVKFGVQETNISHILARKAWRHVQVEDARRVARANRG